MFTKGYTPWNKGKKYRYKPLLRKTCVVCGTEFIKTAKRGIDEWNKRKYCSYKCGSNDPNKIYSRWEKGNIPWIQGKQMPRGVDSPSWKGGRHIGVNGYTYVYAPNHPSIKGTYPYILEHRLVAEKILKRYLTSDEIIHHINGIRDDNRPENLYLFASGKLHIEFHKNIKVQLISNLTC